MGRNMAIKYSYDAETDVPAEFKSLYVEQGGKFVLAGVEGVKPVSEFERVNEALRKERNDHKTTKERFSVWGDLNADEVLAKLDRVAELEQAAGGKLDEEAINKIVEVRMQTRIGPVERAKKKAEEDLARALEQINSLSGERRMTRIRDEVTKAALAHKVLDTAIEDVQLLAERMFDLDEQGRVIVKETGLSPADWLSDLKTKRPHWWPGSRGGASGGSGMTDVGGSNPWTKEGWNMTKQAQVIQAKGEDYAARLAEAAGTKLGALRPK